MKKIIVACFCGAPPRFWRGIKRSGRQYLRVGMEALPMPFNWTQDDDSNGAVPIRRY